MTISSFPGTDNVVAGKLRVIRTLGVGGMGAVFEVEHTITKHRRALKLLHGEFTRSASVVARFLREASAAGRIGNAHVVETFDAGTLDSGDPYIVMELLEGRTLADEISERGALPIGEACEILLQACDGIRAAHAAGVVHRDLKPDNLFLVKGARPFVKILDFGISKFDPELTGAHGLTQEGSALGTPFYMPPEQVRGEKDIGAQADVYALGVILYECLTADKPYSAETLPHLMVLIHEGRYAPPSMRRPELPPECDAVVATAMAGDRLKRYANIDELVSALEVLRGIGARAPRRSHVARHPRGVGGNRSARNACRLSTAAHPRIGATGRPHPPRPHHHPRPPRPSRTTAGPTSVPAHTEGSFGHTQSVPNEEGTCRRLGRRCHRCARVGRGGILGLRPQRTPAESEPAAAAPSSAPPAPTQVNSGPRAEVVVGAPEPPAPRTRSTITEAGKKPALGSSLRYGPDAPTELTCPRARAFGGEPISMNRVLGRGHGTAVAALTFVCAFAPASANAQSESARNEARERFDRGLRLVNQNDNEGALAEFRRAYELVPHPILLYNLGLVLAASGRPVDAVEAFDSLLAAPGNLDAERLARARDERARQLSRIGGDRAGGERRRRLDRARRRGNGQSAPAGAAQDGERRTHRRGRRTGPRAAQAKGECRRANARARRAFAHRNQGKPAQLEIQSRIPEAEVWIDGDLVGHTPLGASVALAPGAREVEVRRAGYVSAKQAVNLGPGSPAGSSSRRHPTRLRSHARAACWRFQSASRTPWCSWTASRVARIRALCGSHTASTQSGGTREFLPIQRTVTVPKAANTSVTIELEPTPEKRADYRSATVTQRTWGYIATGTGAAITLGSLGFVIWNASEEADAKDHFDAEAQKRSPAANATAPPACRPTPAVNPSSLRSRISIQSARAKSTAGSAWVWALRPPASGSPCF